jgi:dimethylargininase
VHYAITREVSATIVRCELTYRTREPIDVALARAQHAAYRAVFHQAGWAVIELPAAAEWPDSVFVEDTAVVMDELAIITRPGAPSLRRYGGVLALKHVHVAALRLEDDIPDWAVGAGAAFDGET